MKFGVCRGLDDFDAIKLAKEAGLDYFETGFGCLANFDEEKFSKCKLYVESIGLPCLAANSFIPGDMNLVGDCVDYGAISEYLDKGFCRAQQLGVQKIVLGSGKARSFSDDFSKEKAYEQLAVFLKEYASPRAEKAGCIIVLEPLRFCETTMIHTVKDGVDVAKLCGADNVFSLADLYHVYGNNDSVAGMMDLKGMVKHAHIAEPVKRVYPCKSDNETVIYIYREFLKTLEKIGCDTCSIEAHTDDFSKDVTNAIELLKTL